METDQLKFVLSELRFSVWLSDEMLRQIAAVSSLQFFAGGSIVFREGQRGDDLLLVRRGRLALEMNVPRRGAVRIMTVGPGEMAGWSALLGEGRMTASAIAVDDVEVVRAPAEKLQELSETDHEFGYRLMRSVADGLSKRLVATRLQLLDLFAETPPSASRLDRDPIGDV